MAVASARLVSITYTGDIQLANAFEAAANAASPGAITTHDLVAGANTITVPTNATVKGATIVPPSDNVETLVLKGVSGDTGISISPTDPTSIGFGTAPVSFVLTAGDDIEGLRILWT